MSFFEDFPNQVHLGDIFKEFPAGLEDLMKFHDVVLRGPSPLTIGQREMIAAYVSLLNDCRFCFNSHRVYAAFYGVEPELFKGLEKGIEGSGVEEKLVPILRYARKITLDHQNIEKSDIDAILAAGWQPRAAYDTATVTALFSYMNRIVNAMGVDPHDKLYEKRLKAVLKKPLKARLAQNQKDIGSNNYYDFGKSTGVY